MTTKKRDNHRKGKYVLTWKMLKMMAKKESSGDVLKHINHEHHSSLNAELNREK